MLYYNSHLAAKFLPLFVFTLCLAVPIQEIAQIKRSVSEAANSYDYIVVGAGNAGLPVADRLSEDPTKTVLVIEYGYIETTPDISVPAPASTDRNLAYFYNYTNVPQAELLKQTSAAYAAAIVGGGSAVDHMMLDRGAADDYDNWEKLGNPGWGWSSLLPYFQKSVTFTPPTAQQQTDFGYTYDLSAYGGNGPIQLSYPPYQWPELKIQRNAWLDLGITATKEGASGKAVGLFWIPSALNPKSETRSYAINHNTLAAPRKNYHLLQGYNVRTLVFSKTLTATDVTIQARDGTDKAITTISAKKEIVLAAGSFGTPVLLQRSGIGPKALLQKAKVSVLVDLPGVGANLQDHAASLLLYTYFSPPTPNTQTAATNATFAAEVQAEYYQNKTGPLTVGYGNAVVFLPLPVVDPTWKTKLASLITQNSLSYLPSTYDLTLKAGYLAQKALLLASYASNASAILEVFFYGDPTTTVILEKPLSRGTVIMNTTDPYADPIINPRTFSNPLDFSFMVAMLRFVRRWFTAPSHLALTPFEIIPGANVTSDADLITAIRAYSVPGIGHPLGTCAMMPRALGGVVDPTLQVYGVSGLSIVDASIMPLAPGTHLDATIYAVAEKAADLIKARA